MVIRISVSRVASIGKYMHLECRICIYLLIIVEKMALQWYTGKVENGNIAFTTHRIW